MLARQRQGAILAEVRAHGSVDITALSRRLGVSEATVRRDLGVLAAQGHPVPVRRSADRADRTGQTGRGAGEGAATGTAEGIVPGGGLRPAPSGARRLHEQESAAEQEAIATAAARFAQDRMTIGLSGGPAIHRLAAHLRELRGLTVVTNSLRTAAILSRSDRSRERPTVILTGGYHDSSTSDDLLHGPVTAMVLRSMRLELAYFDCSGLDGPNGATTDSLADCDTRRALVAASARTCVLATAAQCGSTALSVFATPDQIGCVITAAVGAPSAAQRSVLRRAGGSVCVELTDGSGRRPPENAGPAPRPAR